MTPIRLTDAQFKEVLHLIAKAKVQITRSQAISDREHERVRRSRRRAQERASVV